MMMMIALLVYLELPFFRQCADRDLHSREAHRAAAWARSDVKVHWRRLSSGRWPCVRVWNSENSKNCGVNSFQQLIAVILRF